MMLSTKFSQTDTVAEADESLEVNRRYGTGGFEQVHGTPRRRGKLLEDAKILDLVVPAILFDIDLRAKFANK